jgi:putative flippase GtrA
VTRTTQFVRFAQVGVAGFVVDWSCLSFFLWAGIGFFAGRGLSYFCAATITWALNRLLTFRSTEAALLPQWAKFLSANAVGGMTNYGVSAVLAVKLPNLIELYPVVAVAAGSLSGLVVNFSVSRRFVFRPSL